MNDSPPAGAPIFSQAWAVRLGVAVLVGFAIILGLTFGDTANRAVLETPSETTAVGDTAYFAVPALAKLPLVAATLEGRPLYVRSGDTIEVRDTHTTRVLTDAGTGRTVYRLSASASDGERTGSDEGGYLLKVEPNKYLRAQAAATP